MNSWKNNQIIINDYKIASAQLPFWILANPLIQIFVADKKNMIESTKYVCFWI